jgi:hypothetical protein
MIGGMTASSAELSSLATVLHELTTRITGIADSYASSERDELAADLYAVERALTGAQRRLTKVIDADRRDT